MLLIALAAASLDAPSCFATAHDVPAGATLSAGDLTEVECRSHAKHVALHYDANGSVIVATAAIPAGSYIGRVAPLANEVVAKGAELTLRSSAGPVVIERQVTAIQPGRAGRRLFVRDASGQVFAVRYVAGEGQ